MTQNDTIQDGQVVTLGYKLVVDGELIEDSSAEDSGPVEFIQGAGQIVPGLEKALYGLKVGDSRDVTVSAAEGYGDYDPEAITDIPRDEFPDEIPLEVGVEIQMIDEDDEIQEARIVAVDKKNVRVDFNHPLSGKELKFSVNVLEMRPATPEELEHGHVHDEEWDEDWEEEDEDAE